VAFAAQEEHDDEIDNDSGDDRDADDSGDDRDADDGDCADDVDDDSSVDDYDSSDDSDGENTDDADDSEVDTDAYDAYYSEIVNDADTDDYGIDMDARDAYFEKIRANDEAYRVYVDEGGADTDDAYAKIKRPNFKAYKVYLKANKEYIVKRICEECDADDEELRKYHEKQKQDKLDSDARIAGNVPSEADRRLLERLSTYRHAEYARALRERAARTENDALLQENDANYRVYVEASYTFIREHEELNAQAKKECSAREANGEDARDVRTRWEQFERYSCLGALDDAFFDPRNG
jgi:hypothetical protein